MLEKLLKRLAQMFPNNDYQSRLEQYITNRNPQSTADVEHWERQYHHDRHRQSIVWNNTLVLGTLNISNAKSQNIL